MKYYLQGLAVVLFLFSTNGILAQDNDLNFTFNSNQIIFGENIIETSSVFSKSGNTITWVQTNKDVTDSIQLAIIDIDGNWDQDTSQGSITYGFSFEGSTCSLLLSSQENGLKAKLTFDIGSTEEEQYVFEINNISYP